MVLWSFSDKSAEVRDKESCSTDIIPNFGRKTDISDISFLMYFKFAPGNSEIFMGAAFLQLKENVTILVESVIKAQVILAAKASAVQEGYNTTWFPFVSFCRKSYATDDKTIVKNIGIWDFIKCNKSATEYNLRSWTNMLNFHWLQVNRLKEPTRCNLTLFDLQRADVTDAENGNNLPEDLAQEAHVLRPHRNYN